MTEPVHHVRREPDISWAWATCGWSSVLGQAWTTDVKKVTCARCLAALDEGVDRRLAR